MKSITEAINDVIQESTEDCLSGSIIIYAQKSLRPDKMMKLSLSGRSINSLGDLTSLGQIEHISELDLSGNCIQTWKDVSLIFERLHKLKFLDLSFNPLHSSQDDHFIREIKPHHNLTELVLNSTHISISVLVEGILEKLPNVAKLWLCLNGYDALMTGERAPTCFSSIRDLHLSRNNIRDSMDLSNFCSLFSGLHYLSIRENPLSNLKGLKTDFSRLPLVEINLSDTHIDDWSQLTHLNKFPHLSKFHLLRVPLIEKIPDQNRRDLCISYLPGLKVLNKTPVTVKEREKAERFFIRSYMNSNDKPPRFYELKKIHGELSPLVDIDLSPPKTVSVELQCDGYSDKSISVELNKSVMYLRKLICRELFENNRQIKFKMFNIDAGIPEELKNPHKLLYTFRIRDGDQILIVIL